MCLMQVVYSKDKGLQSLNQKRLWCNYKCRLVWQSGCRERLSKEKSIQNIVTSKIQANQFSDGSNLFPRYYYYMGTLKIINNNNSLV